MSDTPRRSPGRPTKYTPDFHDKQAFQLSLLGLTDEEMARVWDVTRQTVANWKDEHPSFFDALARGKEEADGKVAQALYQRAIGYSHEDVVITSYQGEITETPVIKHYPPDPSCISMWLRNRHRKLWQSAPDPAGGDEVPAPVKVEVKVTDARGSAQPEHPAG